MKMGLPVNHEQVRIESSVKIHSVSSAVNSFFLLIGTVIGFSFFLIILKLFPGDEIFS